MHQYKNGAESHEIEFPARLLTNFKTNGGLLFPFWYFSIPFRAVVWFRSIIYVYFVRSIGHNMILRIPVILFAFCLVTSAIAQESPMVHDLIINECKIGKPACKIQSLIQKWKLVDYGDSTRWLQTLQGEVISAGLNSGKKNRVKDKRCKIHDGDWGIYIRPEAEFSYLAYNTKGKFNKKRHKNLAGCVKAEIKLGYMESIYWEELNLRRLFPPGTMVETCGWWVQDHGHGPLNPATEIHPFIYMRTLSDYSSADSFAVFIADDRSE